MTPWASRPVGVPPEQLDGVALMNSVLLEHGGDDSLSQNGCVPALTTLPELAARKRRRGN